MHDIIILRDTRMPPVVHAHVGLRGQSNTSTDHRTAPPLERTRSYREALGVFVFEGPPASASNTTSTTRALSLPATE